MLESPVSIKDLQNKFATSGVYAIYCKGSDTYYIGQAVIVIRRLADHFSDLARDRHKNKLLQKEYNEFGDLAFYVDLLDDMPDATEQELRRQERKWIQQFKLNFERMYNKTGTSIGYLPRNYQSGKKVNGDTTGGTGERYVLSHAEKKLLPPEEAVCYECGYDGFLSVDIYECDDRKHRCYDCIENHLENLSLSTMPTQTVKTQTKFMRWQYAKNSHIPEQIAASLQKYSEKHNCLPSAIYISLDENRISFDEVQGVAILKRKHTPMGYLDLPLD